MLEILKSRLKLVPLEGDGGEFGGGGGGGYIPPGEVPTEGGGGGGSSSSTSPTGNFLPTITISPNTPQTLAVGTNRCFTALAAISIPQEDERFADFDPEIINGADCYDASIGYWRKNAGGNAIYDAETIVPELIYNKQPWRIEATNTEFSTPGGANNNTSVIMGVRSTGGYAFFWELLKYCNSTPGDCGSGWFAHVKMNTPSTTISLSYGAIEQSQFFRVRSDGTRIWWEYTTEGNWAYNYYGLDIPADAGDFYFFVNGLYLNNSLSYIKTFRGSWQGTVPVEWTTPDGGTLSGTGNTRCFTTDTPGEYSICAGAPGIEPVCVDITADDLFYIPIGFDCDSCIFSGTVVNFQTNAEGILTADGGTVLNSTQWRAPDVEGTYTLTYTVGSNTATCQLTVIEKLELTNVDDILDLLPGEIFQIESNKDIADITFTTSDCDNLITPDGKIVIPYNPTSSCFGAYNCVITATLNSTGTECDVPDMDGKSVQFQLKVAPIFPSRSICGVPHVKWLRDDVDLKVLTNNFDGGCDEVYLKNRTPIIRWNIDFKGLPYTIESDCITHSSLVGCNPEFTGAKVLDDFYLAVGGQGGYFTLYDEETGQTWKNVRFEDKLQKNHVNRFTNHSRTAKIKWSPCCDIEPFAGMCAFVGGIPLPLIVPSIDYDNLIESGVRIFWNTNADEFIITGFELEIDGEITNVGNVFEFEDTQDMNIEHTYRIRAYNVIGTKSQWSEELTLQSSGVITVVVDGEQVVVDGEDVII
jgi:hypothetical protein